MAFFEAQSIRDAGSRVWTDEDEWSVSWPSSSSPSIGFWTKGTEAVLIHAAAVDQFQGSYKIGDPILHIELRRWADIVLIAPCSANTLSKIAHGSCDNLAVSPHR